MPSSDLEGMVPARIAVAGYMGYLTKPISRELLRAALQHYLTGA